ncbi:hypothetical protein FRACA_1390013 [Frankia canadensis]|uniref:Uncharacterized protein n=1 Tax=Frankia canadensis TaxID=1836972 RepID=A0A2I2KL82_9ACTN|nr:hypothetical protein FRACA_1390013 [Frankia canadensis]SOU53687.1 hypothetical protein FRACA_1390013 [Frankia canadensis]
MASSFTLRSCASRPAVVWGSGAESSADAGRAIGRSVRPPYGNVLDSCGVDLIDCEESEVAWLPCRIAYHSGPCPAGPKRRIECPAYAVIARSSLRGGRIRADWGVAGRDHSGVTSSRCPIRRVDP